MRILFIFFILLFSSNSFAGTYWLASNAILMTGSSASSLCQTIASNPGIVANGHVHTVSGQNQNGAVCEVRTNSGFFASNSILINMAFVNGVCPSPLIESGTGECIDVPSCPSGQEDFGQGCEDICSTTQADGETPRINRYFTFPMSESHNIMVDDVLGCEWSHVALTSCNSAGSLDFSDTVCTHEYAETGNYIGTNSASGSENENPILNNQDEDETVTTSDTVVNDGSPTVAGDGTVTDVDVVVTTEIQKQGKKLSESSDKITHSDSSGTETVTTESTETVVHPDNTVTETVDTNVITNSPTITTNSVDKSTGNVSNDNSVSTTNTYTNTVTNVYNSSGGVISTTQTSSGNPPSGEGEGNENNPEDGTFCEYAPEICELANWLQEPHTPSEHPDLPIDIIDVEAEQVSYSSGLGSGSCPSGVSTTFNGQIIQTDYTSECNAVSTVFKPILIFFALLSAGYILAGMRS